METFVVLHPNKFQKKALQVPFEVNTCRKRDFVLPFL